MLDTIQQAGHHQVLVAPIGFICDHVETLFDIDIELKQLAASKGLQLERMPMLNDAPAMLETLRDVLATHESTSCLPS
jgi:ferrochelatase